MTPRQARIGVDLFTAIVVASVGVALAGLTWRLAGDPGERLAATPVVPRAARPIDIRPLIALQLFGTATPTTTRSADGSIVLRGILMAVPASASSALISVGGAPPQAFYVGQPVGGGTIDSIAVDHVVIAAGGQRQILDFPRAGNGLPVANENAPAASAPVGSTGGSPGHGEGGATSPALSDPVLLLSALGATPAGDGLHIGQPGDRARAAGLQPGDVVQKINGMVVSDLLQKPTALQSMQTGESLQLGVLRGGQTLTVSMPTR